jgi:hypothetical protein
LPWAALAAECWREKPNARTSAMLALAWAFGLWVGDIQGLYLQGIVCLAIIAGGLLTPPRVAGRGEAALRVLLLWVLLAAPVLGPILATFAGSSRASGLGLLDAQIWSIHPLRLFEVVLGQPYAPDLIGDGGGDMTERYFDGENNSLWAQSVFAGTALVAFAGLALRQRRRRPAVRRYAALGLLGLLLALGRFTPLWGLCFRFVPVFHAFRFPEKWLPLALLGLAMCAGLGVRRGQARWLAAGGAALLVGAGLWGPTLVRFWVDLADAAPQNPVDVDAIRALSSMGEARLIVGALGLLGLALAMRWRWGLWAPVALQLAQAGWVVGGWAHAAAEKPAHWLLPSPLLGAIQDKLQGGPGRYCWEVDQFQLDPPEGAAYWANMEADQVSLAPEFQALWGLSSAVPYTVGMDPQLLALCPQTHACRWPCQAVLGSRFGVTGPNEWKAFGAEHGRVELRSVDRPRLVLHELPVRQWVDVVGLHHAPTASAAREALQAGTTLDVVHDVVEVGPGDDVPRAAGSVTDLRRPRPDTLEATVSLDAPGVVAISEACSARGWAVTLDGDPVPTFRVNLGLCAVRAPAGKHALLARYTPPGWPWAWAPYFLGWALVGLAWRRP